MVTTSQQTSWTSLQLQAVVQPATWHVWLGAAWAFAAAASIALLPDGSLGRLLIVFPFLLIVPGHLMVQGLVVKHLLAVPRGRHVVYAIGASPVVLGLTALATTIIPRGFTPTNIIGAVTIVCTLFAMVALLRHTRHDARAA